jgi:hypothetical protein
MDDNYDLLQDLEDGLFETPRHPGNGGSSASQWRQCQQQQSEQASSMFGMLGNTMRRISDQYQGAQRDPLGDLDEQEESNLPPPADEEDEAVSESKNEDDEQEQAQRDAYAAEMHRLRLEIDALKRSNAALRQQQSLGSSAPAHPVATSHSSKFVRVYDVPDSLLLETQVSLSKAAYGKPGSSDYRKNKLMATASLSEKFGVARHKVTTDVEEGDQDKYARSTSHREERCTSSEGRS